ncbi:MAG: hypothetical protein MI924_07475 [Chloroflexales bacterium]|nr:hypothetical protein [Chloroflexales bacterium]
MKWRIKHLLSGAHRNILILAASILLVLGVAGLVQRTNVSSWRSEKAWRSFVQSGFLEKYAKIIRLEYIARTGLERRGDGQPDLCSRW